MKRKGLHGETSGKKRRSRCRQRCPHCQQLLSNSQYHEHRKRYFNPVLKEWKTVADLTIVKASMPIPDVPGSSSSDSEGSKGVLENIAELPQLMMASTGSLIDKESLWADLSSIKFGSPYKLARLDRDELAALCVVYHTLYPTLAETSPAMATLYKKYSSLTVAGKRYGSTLA